MITLKNDWKSNRTFQNRKMVQASTLGPNKHKCGRLRYRGELSGEEFIMKFEDFKQQELKITPRTATHSKRFSRKNRHRPKCHQPF